MRTPIDGAGGEGFGAEQRAVLLQTKVGVGQRQF